MKQRVYCLSYYLK